jgi:hypothetical protein
MNSLFNHNKTIYSLDASSLIDAYRFLYPMENFPALWQEFEKLIKSDQFKMSEFAFAEAMRDKVLDEWCREKSLKPYLESKVDDSDQKLVRNILSKYPGMLNVKKGTSGADPWVVALAMKLQNAVVVTEEKLTGNLQYPRIPDVYKASNIECVTIAGIVKKENWIFE